LIAPKPGQIQAADYLAEFAKWRIAINRLAMPPIPGGDAPAVLAEFSHPSLQRPILTQVPAEASRNESLVLRPEPS